MLRRKEVTQREGEWKEDEWDVTFSFSLFFYFSDEIFPSTRKNSLLKLEDAYTFFFLYDKKQDLR